MKHRYYVLLFILGYLASRIFGLLTLPVFADEAIYLRWAQLISNDLSQYAFLPMYDGKTPFYMWVVSMLMPLWRSQPLIIGRLVSVFTGLVTAYVLDRIARELHTSMSSRFFTLLIFLLVPVSFFYQRMALIDAMLAMFMMLTTYGLLKIKQTTSNTWILLTGISFGLAMLSKFPGILIAPLFVLIGLLPPRTSIRKNIFLLTRTGLAGFLGMLIFYGLRVSELFPFLFTRGSDFTVTLSDITSAGLGWYIDFVARNASMFVVWQLWYVSAGVFLALVLGFLLERQDITIRKALWLVFYGLVLASYFLLAGKIVFSRYYLPTGILLVLSSGIVLGRLWDLGRRTLVAICTLMIVGQSVWFALPHWYNVQAMKFEARDQEQYLTDWSSGFGNLEVSNYLKERAGFGSVLVLSEGYFGTLPDGLSIYFDHSEANDMVRIEGIGQPVRQIPKDVLEKYPADEVYLVVNEHRLEMNTDDCCEIVMRHPRPYGGPDLLLIKVKQ